VAAWAGRAAGGGQDVASRRGPPRPAHLGARRGRGHDENKDRNHGAPHGAERPIKKECAVVAAPAAARPTRPERGRDRDRPVDCRVTMLV